MLAQVGGRWWLGNRGGGPRSRIDDVKILSKGVGESGSERVRRGGAGEDRTRVRDVTINSVQE